jgi:hypothetical protein
MVAFTTELHENVHSVELVIDCVDLLGRGAPCPHVRTIVLDTVDHAVWTGRRLIHHIANRSYTF